MKSRPPRKRKSIGKVTSVLPAGAEEGREGIRKAMDRVLHGREAGSLSGESGSDGEKRGREEEEEELPPATQAFATTSGLGAMFGRSGLGVGSEQQREGGGRLFPGVETNEVEKEEEGDDEESEMEDGDDSGSEAFDDEDEAVQQTVVGKQAPSLWALSHGPSSTQLERAGDEQIVSLDLFSLPWRQTRQKIQRATLSIPESRMNVLTLTHSSCFL